MKIIINIFFLIRKHEIIQLELYTGSRNTHVLDIGKINLRLCPQFQETGEEELAEDLEDEFGREGKGQTTQGLMETSESEWEVGLRL